MAVDERLTPETGVVSVRAAGLKVFINYRRDDVPGVALLLQRELAARFGADNVFFDLKSIQPGRRWLEETRTHGSACTAFIALIGSRWVSILAERARSAEEDHVSGEIELALRDARRGSGIVIIPTLIDDAPMPEL